MFLKILKMILYFFVIFAKPAYADNFDSTVDTASNQYFQTIAFSVDGYPDIKDILYQKADFRAESTGTILSSNIDAFTDFDNTRRIPMVADQVDAPPGTQVDIVYLYRNNTGHSVEISQIDWTVSRNVKESGDLTEILEVEGVREENLLYKYSNQRLVKSGLHKEYVGMGVIANGQEGTYILDNVKVKNPLRIDNVRASLNNTGGVDVQVYLQNSSNEYLNNIQFTYGDHKETFNIPAFEEYVLRFSISEIPTELGSFNIYNPNIKQVCAVYGSPYYTYTQSDSISVFAYRGLDIVPGASVQPQRDSFCIKRIPYTMISEPMVLMQNNETNNIEGIETTDTNIVVDGVGDILGAFDMVLPRTGKGICGLVILLVVDVLLWYSVYILRRNYESKNTNSRIRTKGK